jgi:hypothetical protein
MPVTDAGKLQTNCAPVQCSSRRTPRCSTSRRPLDANTVCFVRARASGPVSRAKHTGTRLTQLWPISPEPRGTIRFCGMGIKEGLRMVPSFLPAGAGAGVPLFPGTRKNCDLPCAGWCHPLRRSGIMGDPQAFRRRSEGKGEVRAEGTSPLLPWAARFASKLLSRPMVLMRKGSYPV